jgi:hypothetical protein
MELQHYDQSTVEIYNKTVKKTVGLIAASIIAVLVLVIWLIINISSENKKQDELIEGNKIVTTDVAYMVVQIEETKLRIDTLENMLLMMAASNGKATINNTVLNSLGVKKK